MERHSPGSAMLLLRSASREVRATLLGYFCRDNPRAILDFERARERRAQVRAQLLREGRRVLRPDNLSRQLLRRHGIAGHLRRCHNRSLLSCHVASLQRDCEIPLRSLAGDLCPDSTTSRHVTWVMLRYLNIQFGQRVVT